MNCKTCQNLFPELLLTPGAERGPEVERHLASCPACAADLTSFEATFALLDTWQAPEPSPYFDQKLAVRLREEQAAPRASWLENIRSMLLFNTGRQFRPAMTGALALLLLVGGGTFARLGAFSHPQPAASATVHDLQTLDKNEQALQEMDQLLQDDSPSSNAGTAPPRS